ncbi:MAG: RNA polymerase sigma-70 factor [Dysgonamonadaceae bacterium]|jgi:RNA polymerase sigma-70 factor (ECF subfamily)|nr:RNA polymerase sigma-70 factor [Dysgonamonadaceae bacterium]
MPENNLILRKIRVGDIKAFEALFREYYEALCRYGLTFVDTTDEAEEIVQELFYKIWKNREHLEISFSLKAYLYGAVRNNALQYLEHLQVRQNYAEHFAKQDKTGILSPDEELEYKELNEKIDSLLNELPERRREIFILSRFEGLKYSEIAERFDLSIKTIEAEMTKAFKELRKLKNETNEIG